MNANKRSGRGLWVGLLVVALVGGLGYYFYFQKSKQPTMTYSSLQVGLHDLEVTLLSTGVVQPENRLEIKPPIAGRVETVLVAEGDKVKKGQILAWMSSTERAALLDAARAKGSQELKRWEALYRPTPIMAPINGTIILRNVEAGQTFSNQDSVFSMSNRLTIKAQVDETDLAQIRKGQKARVVLDAYPQEEFLGKVEKLAYDAMTINNVTTYTVDILPDATPDFMRSGMTANVTFLVNSLTGVLAIPSEAIVYREGKTLVLLPNAQNPKEPLDQEIQVGIVDGKWTEVKSGLAEGQTILLLDLMASGDAGRGSSSFMPFGRRRGGK